MGGQKSDMTITPGSIGRPCTSCMCARLLWFVQPWNGYLGVMWGFVEPGYCCNFEGSGFSARVCITQSALGVVKGGFGQMQHGG